MLKVARCIYKVILNILIVLVFIGLIISIYNFVNIKLNNKLYTNYFGYTMFNISSGSMEPNIKVDDYVIVKLKTNYKVGDIVSYKYKNSVVTHRIVNIENNKVITRGDANNTDDQPISIKDIIGKVVHIGKGYGAILAIVKTPMVFISFFASLIFFDIALKEDDKNEKEKKE